MRVSKVEQVQTSRSQGAYQRALLPLLHERVREPRRFIQVIVGPRQVGKTTMISQLVDQLGDGFFVADLAADAVGAGGAGWLDQVWSDARIGWRLSGRPHAILVIDEVQNVTGWAEIVKKNWDADTRNDVPLQVVLSGSSRLLLQEGLSESLLGRFEMHYLGHWTFPEMRDAFGFSPEQFAWFGGYPGAAPLVDDEARFKNYVVNSIIEPSLNRDIFMMSRIDKPALLRQLFNLGVSYSGQIVSLNKMLGQLMDAGNTTTLSRYLHLLDEAGLMAGLNSYSTHPLATRASSPKYQVHNMALFSAMRSQSLMSAMSDSAAWGRVVESTVGMYLVNQVRQTPNASLYYWRDGSDEVDFVLDWGGRPIGIEVKSTSGPTRGLVRFAERFPDAATLTISSSGLDWQTFLATPLQDVVAALN